MINVNSLNQAIASLKAETSRDAITPVYLGNLLQGISDLLATATTADDLSAVTQLQIALANLKQKVNSYVISLQNDPTFISHLVQGASDRNNVYLDATKVAIAFGTATTVEQAVTIKQATTERAGVMRAQQVQDLSDAKSGVTALNAAMASVQSTITELQYAIAVIEESATKHFHIECKSNMRDGLHVLGANSLVRMGYVPYIFRYSRKKSRYRLRRTERRRKGPKMRGWNMFCGEGKISFSEHDLMLIARHTCDGIVPDDVSEKPEKLFSGENLKYDDQGMLVGIRVGYGCDEVEVSHGKRFRFAVAFSRPQTSERFDFSKLVTNLAEFGVYVYHPRASADTFIDYRFSR